MNFPARHGVHWLAPWASEYAPAGQFVHPKAPTPEYLPAAQGPHDPAPDDALNVPAAHDVHGPPFCPPAPALQVQAARTLLEAPEFEFGGHGPHALAPTTIEYVPTPQFGILWFQLYL